MEAIRDAQSKKSSAQISNESVDGALLESEEKSAEELRTIRKWDVNRVSSIVLDTVLLGNVLVVIAYAFAVMHYENIQDDVSAYTILSRAARLGPTVLPILFATIATRALKAVAVLKLEGGSYIGHLDQLVGSTSIISTIVTQFKLRAFNVLGLVLITLWALSPLSSQASIRILENSSQNLTAPITIQFPNVSSRMMNERYSVLNATGLFAQSNALFAGALSAPTSVKESSTDIWGNVKIPLFEAWAPWAADPEGWMTANGSEGNLAANMGDDESGTNYEAGVLIDGSNSYASLIGLPTSITLSANVSFSIETSYWYLTCQNITKIDHPSQCNRSGWDTVGDDSAGMYLSSPPADLKDDWTTTNSSCHHISYCGWDNVAATEANCTISNSYVEVRVLCVDSLCTATQIRRSRIPQPPVCQTQLDKSNDNFLWFTTQLVKSLGLFPGRSATPFQGYLIRPDTPFNLTNLPPVYDMMDFEFAVRFSQVLNTYWSALLAASTPSSTSAAETFSFSVSSNGNTQSLGPYFDLWPTASPDTFVNTTGTITITYDHTVRCNFLWLAVLLITAVILLIGSAISIYATSHSMSPEILFNVSSTVNESPFVTLPKASSALSGADRAKMIKHVKVRYGDVDGDKDIGRIAIATYRDEFDPDTLKEGRLYA